VKDDITTLDVESFVYYARSDLNLGSGLGGAITVRGGPSIQEELTKLAPIEMSESVVSDAGDLKAKKIIHANGPKFQEEDIEEKLKTTVLNALKTAEENGFTQVAFPAMGAGFYGVPLNVSAEITLGAIKEYLEKGSRLTEVIVSLLDNREYTPFEAQLSKMD
jgi:O-acetyl-ADP-ribose deacetylase (regulator of RNase III)